MRRRNFIQSFLGLFGITALSRPDVVTTDSTPVTGPYSVDIREPADAYNTQRALPLFDNMRQAENFAIARQHFMTRDMTPDQIGRIYITLPNGKICKEITWSTHWSTTVCHANCVDDWRRLA